MYLHWKKETALQNVSILHRREEIDGELKQMSFNTNVKNILECFSLNESKPGTALV